MRTLKKPEPGKGSGLYEQAWFADNNYHFHAALYRACIMTW